MGNNNLNSDVFSINEHITVHVLEYDDENMPVTIEKR